MERDELQLEGWDYEVETCEHDDYCYCSPWYCGCNATPTGKHDPIEED